jgi:hypothetical protein
LAVLERQRKLHEQLRRAGRIHHSRLFFMEDGQAIHNIADPGRRWRQSLAKLPIRRRRPYCARHSSVSWNLMIGKNPLWVARQHGHSVRTMLEVYAAWAEDAVESDIEAIERAMGMNGATMSASSAPAAIVASAEWSSAARRKRLARPLFSIWHWIRHHKRDAWA